MPASVEWLELPCSSAPRGIPEDKNDANRQPSSWRHYTTNTHQMEIAKMKPTDRVRDLQRQRQRMIWLVTVRLITRTARPGGRATMCIVLVSEYPRGQLLDQLLHL